MPIAKGEGNLEPLKQLEILREVLAGEMMTVTKDKHHVRLLQDAFGGKGGGREGGRERRREREEEREGGS